MYSSRNISNFVVLVALCALATAASVSAHRQAARMGLPSAVVGVVGAVAISAAGPYIGKRLR